MPVEVIEVTARYAPRVVTARHKGADIRAGLSHPVIDGDGHHIEYLPLVRDILVDIADRSVMEALDRLISAPQLVQRLRPAQRRAFGGVRSPWWVLPTRNTLDRATAMLPRLMASRLDDLGIDHSILYPTYGLAVAATGDAELRQALARALNIYYAQTFAEHGDRLTPVGVIPMHDPDEAVAELDFATGELGLKAFTFGGPVERPLSADGRVGGHWMDSLGVDSQHDYDRVWRRCVELGVSPTFHTSAAGWDTHGSVSNYMFNHLGVFATAGELVCRSLLLNGVAHRFPTLRFAFQEGGVGRGAGLFASLVEHWTKRNAGAIDHYNPAHLDRGLLGALFEEHGSPAFRERLDRMDGEALEFLSVPDEPLDRRDEFGASGFTSRADIQKVFSEQLFFGCEADDPMTPVAFDRQGLLGVTMRPIFASDIGHWDVPDIEEVLPEAWELVEDGHLDEAEFRAFTFGNGVALWATSNPGFFDGTTVAAAVEKERNA